MCSSSTESARGSASSHLFWGLFSSALSCEDAQSLHTINGDRTPHTQPQLPSRTAVSAAPHQVPARSTPAAHSTPCVVSACLLGRPSSPLNPFSLSPAKTVSFGWSQNMRPPCSCCIYSYSYLLFVLKDRGVLFMAGRWTFLLIHLLFTPVNRKVSYFQHSGENRAQCGKS